MSAGKWVQRDFERTLNAKEEKHEKSNLLKKAVSVLLVASALAGCGSSATQTATTAAPAASGTETSAAATEAGSTGNTAESGTILWQWFLHGIPLSHLILQAPIQM